MLYICTKFHENISRGFSVIEQKHDFHSEIFKGQNFVKNVDGVTVLVLCISSDDALYLYKVS